MILQRWAFCPSPQRGQYRSQSTAVLRMTKLGAKHGVIEINFKWSITNWE